MQDSRRHDHDMGLLVSECRQGHPQAWRTVVEEFTPIVWTVARSLGLRPSDCEDVCQTTWMHAVRSIDTIEDPDRLRTWIATVARREAIKSMLAANRHVPVAEIDDDQGSHDDDGPEHTVLARVDDGRAALALRMLPVPHQELMVLLTSDPAPSYDEISERLAIPRGSIGPTRNRILARMRVLLADDAQFDDEAYAGVTAARA